MRSFDDLTITTERLLLRPLAESDADSLFAIYSDPEVMKYWSTLPWSDISQAKELIQKDIDELPKGVHLRLGIEIKREAKLIGTCSLFAFNEQCKRAEIGYILAKNYWGKGIMKEALTALIDFSFNTLCLHRIEADIDPLNQPSSNILNSLGFSKEGYLRERWIINDKYLDSELYGLLRQDWVDRE